MHRGLFPCNLLDTHRVWKGNESICLAILLSCAGLPVVWWFSSALPVVGFPILMPMLACSSHCARLSFEQPSWWMFLSENPNHFGGGEENNAANPVQMQPKEEGRDVFFHSVLIMRIKNLHYYAFFIIFCRTWREWKKSLVLSRTAGLRMLLGSPSSYENIILARWNKPIIPLADIIRRKWHRTLPTSAYVYTMHIYCTSHHGYFEKSSGEFWEYRMNRMNPTEVHKTLKKIIILLYFLPHFVEHNIQYIMMVQWVLSY